MATRRISLASQKRDPSLRMTVCTEHAFREFDLGPRTPTADWNDLPSCVFSDLRPLLIPVP